MNDRPEHEDFWKLAQIIQTLDGSSEMLGSDVEKFMKEQVDKDSLSYLAVQRALRAINMIEKEINKGTPNNEAVYMMVSAAWVEGFYVGLLYERTENERSISD